MKSIKEWELFKYSFAYARIFWEWLCHSADWEPINAYACINYDALSIITIKTSQSPTLTFRSNSEIKIVFRFVNLNKNGCTIIELIPFKPPMKIPNKWIIRWRFFFHF